MSEIPNASESRLSTLATIASSEGLGSVSSAIQARLNEIEEEKKRIALEATLREEFRLSLSKMTFEAILKLKTDNLNHKYIDLINNELASLNAAFDEIHNMINTSNSIKELYSLKVTARRYEQLQVLIDGRIKSLSLNGGIVKHDDIYNPTNEDLGKVPIYAISEIGQVTEIAPESDGQYLATEGINKFYRKYMFTTSNGLSHLRTEKSPIDLIKNLLNIVGFVPVIGEVADALSGTISLIEGKYFDAVLSGISLLATVGNVIAVPLRNIAYFFSAAVQSSETALDLINTVKRLLKVDDAVKLATFMRNAFDGFSLKVYKKLEEAKAVILGVLKGIVDKTMFTNLSTYLGRELNGIHNSLHKLELEISQFYNKINDVENIAKGTNKFIDGFKADSAYEAMSSGAVDDILSKMDVEEYLRLEELGETMYDGFGAMDDDFIKIANNTEFSLDDLKDIKEHLFFKKHKFADGSVRKFDANYWQAEAWDRLIKGTPEPSDITLLNHELFELKYMRDNNVAYEVAHAKANELFNWSVEVFGK